MGMLYAADVMHTAHCYVGYEEGDNNWTIFSQKLDDCGYYAPQKKQGQPWCANFCYAIMLDNCLPDDRSDEEKKWDVLNFTGQPSKYNYACAAYWGARYFKEMGRWFPVSEAKQGDVIFFKSSDYVTDENPDGIYHQGMVDRVEDGRVYTVEGNKSDSVQEFDYSIRYNRIAGVGRPLYDEPATEKPVEKPKEDPKPTPAPIIIPKPAAPKGKKYTVSVNTHLNVRHGPGSGYQVVDKLYNGEEVTVYEEQNGFGRISNDMDIWVSMKYLV